jgi:archaellum component FlaC
MSFLLFATAITLSAIAAFYAVAGLVAIFAASSIPIMIMGGALESAKLVVASWLYRNWKEIPVLMKTYFTIALVILMMLTSMGIFGYLSKAHLDQAVPTGDVSAKLNLIDEKIKTQKENIDAARKQLSQLDQQVDQTLSRTTEASGVDRSVQIRRSQNRERTSLLREIETSQTEIAKLNQERAPIASEVRKVEAEVGPIKYIAALLYGDTLDDNLLESAVRIVIIMIVLVFDPLAVLMLIAWNREQSKGKPQQFFERAKEVAKSIDEGTYKAPEVKEPEIDKYAYLKKPWSWKVPGVESVGPQVYKPEPAKQEEPEVKPEDWEPELYRRADVPIPKKTEDFLAVVEDIKQQPIQPIEPTPTIELQQESPFSARETEFTINSDIQEVLSKPTNGRPDKYK